MMDKNTSIFVAGHRGLVGAAICRLLRARGYNNLITRTHAELDLTDASAVNTFFDEQKPEAVILAAAKVGGIQANSTWPADFIMQNIAIESNVIGAALRTGCDRLLFLGSSCIYPRECPQPIREEYLLTSPLEKTNEAYALAKITGLKMCEFINRQHGRHYLSVMPTNLYGPGDNSNLVTSHVIPALIRRFHEAKQNGLSEITLWGTGNPRREFLYVDDMADACVYLFCETDACELTNIGTGTDITIRETAELVAKTVGYTGSISFDHIHPDGTPQKLLDVSRLNSLGWRARVSLEDGLRLTYKAFLDGESRM